MARMHAPELEDEAWLPRPLRDGLTAFLQVSAEKLGVFDGAGPILREVLLRAKARTPEAPSRIVDLCSGGGGPLLSLLEELGDVEAVLTDLYPNLAAFERAESRLGSRVRGNPTSVNATDVPASLRGVRTLFNALHHFRPDDARKILEDAARQRQPLCVFEVVERHPVTLGVIAAVPLAVLALVPFTRPDALRLALTYALPIIPAITGWDGMASCLRAYSVEELEQLAASITVDGYRFRVGQQARRGLTQLRVTWLVGEPETAS